MSVAYGSPTGGYAPPGRVNFGWIGEAFELFKASVGVWIVAVLLSLVPVLISFIVGAIYGASTALSGNAGSLPAPNPADPTAAFTRALTGGLPPGLTGVIRIVTAIYTAWLYGGIYQAAVKQVRGEAISIGDLFSGGSLMWKMLGFYIVYILAVGIGTLLCIVPGLLLASLLFPGYALIADGENVGNAISRSIDAMKRDMWNAAAFVFVLGLLLIVSAIPCGLGLFVTLPMLWITAVLAYRDMIGMPGGAASPYGAAPYGVPQAAAPGVWPPPPGQAPPYGQQPPPPAFGQQSPFGQPAPPPPSFGQTPPAAPPRRTLGGDPLEEDGTDPPRPNQPPGGPAPQ